MKNKNKISSALKLRQGFLVNWTMQPLWNYKLQNKIYQVVRYWLLALNEIPINYIIFKYLQLVWKQKKKFLFLKYRFLKKNILNKKKKKFLFLKWKQKKDKNFSFRITKFWRPKYVPASQLGKVDFHWYKSGLHLNIPLFFLPSKARSNLRKNIKQKKKIFIKKSKIQILKIFFFKLILERKLKKFFDFPVILNFRNLTLTSKKELRLQTNQRVVYKDFFFFRKDKLIRRTISALTFGFYYANSQIIAQQIANRLTRTRRHYKTLYQLKTTLHYLRLLSPETKGYQIDVYGKIGANTRTTFFRMSSGKTPKLQSLASRTHYTFQECFTYTGVFGVHVWLNAGL